MKLIPWLRKSVLLFAIINLSNLVTLPLSLHENYAQLLSKYRGQDSHIPKYISADCLNAFFAKISSGEHPNSEGYDSLAIKCDVEISEYQIEKILRCVKRTSTGWDGLPLWLFKKCSVELASVVTHLINYSINEGQIPDIWRTAIVTPVPKLTQSFQVSLKGKKIKLLSKYWGGGSSTQDDPCRSNIRGVATPAIPAALTPMV